MYTILTMCVTSITVSLTVDAILAPIQRELLSPTLESCTPVKARTTPDIKAMIHHAELVAIQLRLD